jgi:hypothetical protein
MSNFNAKYLRARSVEKKSSMAHILDSELKFFSKSSSTIAMLLKAYGTIP